MKRDNNRCPEEPRDGVETESADDDAPDDDAAGATRTIRSTALALPNDGTPFDRSVLLACFSLAANESTQRAYWTDFKVWREFCVERGVDAADPPDDIAAILVMWLKARNEAPKTRARRISALASVYRRLCRPRKDKLPLATRNPFCVEAADRERASARRPTPLANPDLVRRFLAACDLSQVVGVRDVAIVRVLWACGIRRISLLSMAYERLRRERDPRSPTGVSYVATVIGKRGKEQRILIRGKAAAALDAWLALLAKKGIKKGPIWHSFRSERGFRPLTARELGRMFATRLEAIGEEPGALTCHQFRVAFLTYCPANLESKQDAANHSDPQTTRLYDRSSWRAREAFELMPEIEDVDDVEKKR